jgi:hypothetical protein
LILVGTKADSIRILNHAIGMSAHVLVNVVQATVVGDESGDLLSVLDQLDTGALTDGRVRLLGLNTSAK